MVTLTDIIGYLLSHPSILAGVAILVLALIVSIIKKIIKVAFIIVIVIALAGAAIYYAAGDAVKEQGERILDDVKEQFNAD